MSRPAPQTTFEPRCMTAAEAASYCRLTESGFRARVKKLLLPGPLPGTHRWDRKAIDRALDKMSGLEADREETALQRWRREHAAR